MRRLPLFTSSAHPASPFTSYGSTASPTHNSCTPYTPGKLPLAASRLPGFPASRFRPAPAVSPTSAASPPCRVAAQPRRRLAALPPCRVAALARWRHTLVARVGRTLALRSACRRGPWCPDERCGGRGMGPGAGQDPAAEGRLTIRTLQSTYGAEPAFFGSFRPFCPPVQRHK